MIEHKTSCDCPNCYPQAKVPLVGILILAVPVALFLLFLNT